MPFNGVNPSIRVYDYDVKERKIVSYQQHYLPLDELHSENDNEEVSSTGKSRAEDEFLIKGDQDDRRNRNSKFMKHPSESNRKKRDLEKDKKAIKVGRKGKGTPKWVKNPKFLKCLDKTTKIFCLPSIKPKNCSQSMYKKMKSLSTPPPDCDITKSDGSVNIDGTSSTVDPNISLKSQTDESFPLNPVQDSLNVSEDPSLNDKEDVDKANNDDENQTNASKSSKMLVDKWKFAFDASRDLNVSEMTPEAMLNVWSNMKSYERKTFAAFEKELVVLRKGFKANKDQHAYIICSIRHVLEDELKDCLSERDSKMPPPWWNQKNKTDITKMPEDTDFTTLPTSITTASTTTVKQFVTTTTNDDIFTTESQKDTTIRPDSIEDNTNMIDISTDKVPSDEEGASSGVTAVVVLTLLVLLITGAIILYKRRDRWRNRQSDEFLLTDSVFKYDGYSQVDQP